VAAVPDQPSRSGGVDGFLHRPRAPAVCCSSLSSVAPASTHCARQYHEHSKTTWFARQVIDAIVVDTALRRMLPDRDQIRGNAFRCRLAGMGIVSSPATPWANPYVERLIRREMLNHMITQTEAHQTGVRSITKPKRFPRNVLRCGRAACVVYK